VDAEERFARIESAIDRVSDNQARLDDALVTLAEAQIESVRRFNAFVDETNKRFQQTDERFRQTGERIDNLVSAIGALIRERRN